MPRRLCRWCGQDLDRVAIRVDAVYCSPAHYQAHRRAEPDLEARRAARPYRSPTGTRPETRYAVLRRSGDSWRVVGHAFANKAEQAKQQLVGDSAGHIAVPARYFPSTQS